MGRNQNTSLPLVNILDELVRSKTTLVYTGSSESYSASILNKVGSVPTDEKVLLSSGELTNPRWSYASAKTFGEYCLAAAANQCE